jgi:hypothetical protein
MRVCVRRCKIGSPRLLVQRDLNCGSACMPGIGRLLQKHCRNRGNAQQPLGIQKSGKNRGTLPGLHRLILRDDAGCQASAGTVRRRLDGFPAGEGTPVATLFPTSRIVLSPAISRPGICVSMSEA